MSSPNFPHGSVPRDDHFWVAANEEKNQIPEAGWTRQIIVEPHTRLFRVSDELASKALLDWSEPVQLKLDRRDDGTYDLIARSVPKAARGDE